MGYKTASELSDASELGDIFTLMMAIEIHLRVNHYPPLPLSLVTPAIEVINAYRDEDWDRLIELPEGVTWRGEQFAPARECVDAWHLRAFTDNL